MLRISLNTVQDIPSCCVECPEGHLRHPKALCGTLSGMPQGMVQDIPEYLLGCPRTLWDIPGHGLGHPRVSFGMSQDIIEHPRGSFWISPRVIWDTPCSIWNLPLCEILYYLLWCYPVIGQDRILSLEIIIYSKETAFSR